MKAADVMVSNVVTVRVKLRAILIRQILETLRRPMALYANSRPVTGEISVLTLTKCPLANVAISHRESYPKEYFFANTAWHPLVLSNFLFIVMLLIKRHEINFSHMWAPRPLAHSRYHQSFKAAQLRQVHRRRGLQRQCAFGAMRTCAAAPPRPRRAVCPENCVSRIVANARLPPTRLRAFP